jgi:shikimate kinase
MNDPGSLPKNIILIGFMGCGKSTVGRELHQRLGYPLIDMDHAIEQAARKPISRIFADEGETGFRDRETALLRQLVEQATTCHIISTGGGIVVRPENRDLLRQLGYVVWLHATPDTILDRTRRNSHRPLLQTPDPAATIRALLDQRIPWYAETAHLKIETAGLDSTETASGITECARYHFTQSP